MAPLDSLILSAALQRWCAAMREAAPEFNALDARLGDGDLGTTLQKCAENVEAVLPVGDTPAAVFKACASACAKASGSSFGTLLAQAFLVAAKSPQAQQPLDRQAVQALLPALLDALSARGGAKLGDKTMLDSMAAIAEALRAAPPAADAAALKAAACAGAQSALDALRGQPNRIGRARMFAEQSKGLDDPGMVAVLRMVQAL